MIRRAELLALSIGFALCFGCSCGRGDPLPKLPAVAAESFLPSARAEVGELLERLKNDPQDASSNGRLGMFLQAHELYGGAKACFLRAQALDTKEFRWPYCLGVVQTTTGELEAAVDSFNRAIELRSDANAYIRQAEVLLSLDRLDDSRRFFEDALQLAADSSRAYYGLGRVLVQQGEARAAIPLLLKASDLAPNSGATHYTLALAYRDFGDAESSRSHLALSEKHGRSRPPIDDPVLRDVQSLRADQHWHLNEGRRLEQEGRAQEAISHYHKAIELDSEFAAPHVNLVGSYGRLKRFDRAETHYHRALGLDPDIEELHNNRGTVQVLRGRPREAVQSFERVLEINPTSADGYLNLGSTLAELGRTAEAIRHFRQALEYEPNHRLANFQIGRHLVAQGKPDQAIGYLKITLGVEDERTPGFLYGLADAHLRAGRKQQAVDYARRALAMAQEMGQTEMATSIRDDLKDLEAIP